MHFIMFCCHFLLCSGCFTSWYDGMRNTVSECRVIYGLFIHVFIYFFAIMTLPTDLHWSQSHASLLILDYSSENLLYHWVTFVLFNLFAPKCVFYRNCFLSGPLIFIFYFFYLFLVWVVWSLLKSSTVNYSAIKFLKKMFWKVWSVWCLKGENNLEESVSQN